MATQVFLIGAGPGDPDLITLKAIKALQTADVVLVDDLVNRALLQHAPRARVIEVGKRGGCKSTPQDFINRLMIRLARQGRIVARLKGGDPFLFGRGGEEMLALRAAGVTLEVVPGITSGIAVPAAIGIPVTHRGATHGVTFVTGHTQDGRGPDWAALAAGGTTLAIYMGMQQLGTIVTELLAAGMAPDTPAAAIQNGTLASQRHVAAPLRQLPEAVKRQKLGSPAIVVVGQVAALAQQDDGRHLQAAA